MDAKRFEVFIEDITQGEDIVLAKVNYGAVCKADIRYYLGGRDSKVLGLKYPISLIHEALGTVLRDRTNSFAPGDKVVFVPNISGCVNGCSGFGEKKYPCGKLKCVCLREELGENYCPKARFASSNWDGFSKEIVSLPPRNIVKIKDDDPCFVFCELVSVAVAALRRASLDKDSHAAVYGDGVMGYILCSVIREMYDCTIYAVGKHPDRLGKFTMCDELFLTSELKKKTISFDTGFECIGGTAAATAINSITNLITVGGTMVLMGVSEEAAALNTRGILQKGLTLKGSTRSSRLDFVKAVKLFDSKPFKARIEDLILDEIRINSISDYYHAFETECMNKMLGKYILKF